MDKNSSSCCCFFPSLSWERVALSDHDLTRPESASLWRSTVGALKKAREWSEIVAGPRWKNFIRRFNRSGAKYRRTGSGAKFGYDPFSYAMNFDEGSDDVDIGRMSFSTRFVSGKSSVDMGDAAAVVMAPPTVVAATTTVN